MLEPGQFRKRPVVIDAVRLESENVHRVAVWCGALLTRVPEDEGLVIPTLEGMMTAHIGDWIVRGVKGEFYPVRPDIFDATYESDEK